MLHEKFPQTDCRVTGSPERSRAVAVENVLVSTGMPALTSHLVGEIADRHPEIRCVADTDLSIHDPIATVRTTVAVLDPVRLHSYLAESAEIAQRFHTVVLVSDSADVDAQIPASMRIVALTKPNIGQFMQAFSGILSGQITHLQHEKTGDEAIQLKDEKKISPALTKRESEVFEGMIKGRRYKQIADSLGLSEATVKVHAYRIFDKTGIRGKHRLASIHYGTC